MHCAYPSILAGVATPRLYQLTAGGLSPNIIHEEWISEVLAGIGHISPCLLRPSVFGKVRLVMTLQCSFGSSCRLPRHSSIRGSLSVVGGLVAQSFRDDFNFACKFARDQNTLATM
eukprot:TRINITY_DN85672_c0_g1_i1.p1 TRINITY_DN85672_c0_g1~~TRINITY_DN85672_c0_g1_i1.p1  ORF type:complete len:116 (+),score=14.11 TRINITY_DN85672_c0_g1_i1:243-590(+)